MKNLIYTFFFAIIIALSFISCKDKEVVATPDPVIAKPIISTSSDSLKFTESAGTSTVKVTMNGNSWSVLSDQTWCSLSFNTSTKTSDNLDVTVAANNIATIEMKIFFIVCLRLFL